MTFENFDGYSPEAIPEDRERKSFVCEIKADDVDDLGYFKGYAAYFNNLDSWDDIIIPGAFKKTLKKHGKDVVVLYQHDSWTPIGLPISMEEDQKGLMTESRLILDLDDPQKAHILMKNRLIKRLSIGYYADPKKQKYIEENGKRIRELNEITQLFEFSPVTFAANPKAKITSVKSIDDLRALEQWLIAEGISRRAAKYLASRHQFDAQCDAAGSKPIGTKFDALRDAATAKETLQDLCDCLKTANRTIFTR